MPMFDSTVRKNGQRRCSSCSRASRSRRRRPPSDSSAEPVPYQPGSMIRACDQLNTHGMARRSEILSPALRDGGRLPMFSSPSSLDRRRRAEPLDEARGLVHQRAGRPAGPARRGRRAARRPSSASSPRPSTSSRLASSVAATSASRLRRARSGSAYLAAMTSPCSVIRSAPATAPGRLGADRLVARAAAAADRAAAAVEEPQPDVLARGRPRPGPARPGTAPSWRRGSRRPCCCRSSRA